MDSSGWGTAAVNCRMPLALDRIPGEHANPAHYALQVSETAFLELASMVQAKVLSASRRLLAGSVLDLASGYTIEQLLLSIMNAAAPSEVRNETTILQASHCCLAGPSRSLLSGKPLVGHIQ